MLLWFIEFVICGGILLFMANVAEPVTRNLIIKPFTKDYNDTERKGWAILVNMIISFILIYFAFDEIEKLSISIVRSLLS